VHTARRAIPIHRSQSAGLPSARPAGQLGRLDGGQQLWSDLANKIRGLTQDHLLRKAPRDRFRATLDVPREVVWFLAKLLAAERQRRGTPRGSRALTCFWRAVLGLRWFRDRTAADALARDHRISRATAHRRRDEVIEVLAEQAPDLREALEQAQKVGFAHVILDGKIIPCDRYKDPTRSVK